MARTLGKIIPYGIVAVIASILGTLLIWAFGYWFLQSLAAGHAGGYNLGRMGIWLTTKLIRLPVVIIDLS